MASSSNDKAAEPPLQDHKDPATSSDEPPPSSSLPSSSSLQENVQPRDGHSEPDRATTRRTAASQNRPPFLRSGSTTSAAFTSNGTTQPSPPPSPDTATATATATAAPVLRLRPNSAPDDNHPDQVEQSWKDLQEALPSPGTIETQIARVDMHRRSISGESGYLGDQPDPTNPDTPPKTIPPPSESSPRDIPDDYYERKFGILLLRKGHKEFYVVTDKEVFEAWLSTQENIPKTRPNLRLGESGRIVRYREDYPGLVLGDITPESIGIKLLDDGVGTDYRIIDPDKFKAFLAKHNLRGECPTFQLVIDGPSIRHEEAIVQDSEARGILLHPSTLSHPHHQYYTVNDEDLYNAWRATQSPNGSYPDIPINSRNYNYRPPPTLDIVRDSTQPARRSISFAGERPTIRAVEGTTTDNIRTRPAVLLSSVRQATPPGSPMLRELRENQLLQHEAALSRFRDANDDSSPPYEEASEHPGNDGEEVTRQSHVDVSVSEVGPDDDSPSLTETSEHPRNEGEEVTQQSRGAADVSEVGLDGPNDSNLPAETDVLDEFEDGDILRRFAELLTGSEVDERRTPPSEVIDRLNATGAQHWDPLQDDDEQDDDDVYSVNG